VVIPITNGQFDDRYDVGSKVLANCMTLPKTRREFLAEGDTNVLPNGSNVVSAYSNYITTMKEYSGNIWKWGELVLEYRAVSLWLLHTEGKYPTKNKHYEEAAMQLNMKGKTKNDRENILNLRNILFKMYCHYKDGNDVEAQKLLRASITLDHKLLETDYAAPAAPAAPKQTPSADAAKVA